MQKKHAELVTKRFLKAMNYIVAEKMEGVTTKAEFAGRVGEFRQNIHKMESGTRYPAIDVMVNACLVFGIDPAWLLLNRGSMFPKETGSFDSDILQRLNELEKRIGKPKDTKRVIKKKVA